MTDPAKPIGEEEKRREELLVKLRGSHVKGTYIVMDLSHDEARRLLSAHDAGIWEAAAKVGREACESRARSLFHDSKQITASGEASKCGLAVESAIRNHALRAQKGASDGA